MSLLDSLKALFGRGEPVATPAPGTPGEQDRETSTNAQIEGAVGEAYDENA